MNITTVTCKNFRNIKEVEIKPVLGLNVFTGSNAQGKSNLLEAIYMFVAGKSYRTVKTADVINFDSTHAEIGVELHKKDLEHQLFLHLESNKKNLTIDGVVRKRISDLLGHLNIVSFFPRDLSLISGGPRLRRDFIDLEISQVIPSFYKTCQNYNRVLKQRNMLLRNAYRKSFSQTLLNSYNDQLINYGTLIIIRRLETLYKLSILAKLSHRQLTNSKENLTMKYISNIGIDDPLSQIHKIKKEKVEDLILQKIKSVHQKEIERRSTLVGPHLDDISFIIDGYDAKRYGSQGQQRTTVLSLKLAELQFMRSETGEMPILILDDVLSELDKQRQILLLETAVSHTQTFVATTDTSLLADNIKNKARIYQVSNGVITIN